MKRLVKKLYLKPDAELIKKYRYVHENIWPEIKAGILSAGVDNMELYLLENLAIMIVELEDSLDPDEIFAKLANDPKQQEWENFVAEFQECNEGDSSAEKWQPMERIFSLKEGK